MKEFINKNYKRIIVCLSFFLIFIILIIKIYPTFSEKLSSSIWDGSIATKFADGDGSVNNPYIINNGSEFALLFSKLKSEDSYLYFNKYYEIHNNINFDGRDFSFIDSTKTFSGNINGNGYTLSNIKLNSCSYNNINNSCEYSLFSNLDGATIKNINIINLTVNSDVINNNRMVSALSISATNSYINNISLNNIEYKISKDDNYITKSAGLLVNDIENNNIENIHVDLKDNDNNGTNLIYNYNNSNVSNIIYNINSYSLFNNSDVFISSSYGYNKVNDIIVFENKYPVKSVINILNKKSELIWAYTDNTIRIRNIGVDESVISDESSSISSHESGVFGSTVYVNDFIADYDYYMGLNYTVSNNRNIPTRVSKNVYSSSNLVYVASTYKGSDYNNQNTGYVSLNEKQDTYVYYKIYEVNNNGTSDKSDDYIEYELIDNPFANRPNDKAFNGWLTEYPNAQISIDQDIYVRKVRIPVYYDNGVPKPIEITFYASWIKARTYNVSGNNWSGAFNYFFEAGLQLAKGTISYWDIDDLYYLVKVPRYGQIYAGDYQESGWYGWQEITNNTTCRNNGGCEVMRPARGTEYSASNSYYTKTESWYGAGFSETTPQHINETSDQINIGDLAGGLYREIILPYGEELYGYYNSNAEMLTTGICNQTNGCKYYELIKVKNENGSLETVLEGVKYYFLVTRDTNIAFVNGDLSGSWSNQKKPFTLTSINNNINNIDKYYWNMNSNVQIGADTRIEMIRIYSGQSMQNNDSGPITNRSILGNYYNLKMGRGIKQYNNSTTFSSAAGGSLSFSGNQVKRYTFIVESGFYNNLGLTTITSSSGTHYVVAYGTYGNDYDRVNNNNDNLIVQYCASGSWAGTIRSYSTSTVALNTTIKSGNIGKNNYQYAAGLYVGGRNNGNHYVLRNAIIEGGIQANVIGGPLSVESNVKSGNTFLNDTYIYVKGGNPEIVVGGAGASSTYGNRVIQVTGGTVNYAVFGGSNGVTGSDGGTYPGILYGDSYVYIGGHAVIGNGSTNIHSVSAVESGSVFGAGNGNSSSVGVGSVNNSYVVIDGDAIINKNIYGGGNYGATGYGNSTTYNPSNTEIVINGGTINGSVYGAGNNNGAGNYAHTVSSGSGWNQTRVNFYDIDSNIKIEMNGGIVGTGIYGGSNVSGTVYGSTSLYINNGSVANVYGGGEGQRTFVRDDISVNIGTESVGPTISGNVYGGSAYGTVNALATSASANNKYVNVTVNNGKITGDVFGGAKGAGTITPYVKGNITVNINGGTISGVYGGFDANGTPDANDYVYLNGGVIGLAFGGGKNTSQTTTNIYLKGSNCEYVYGGSNQSGDVDTTNVYVSSGIANYVFGGNNLGGTCNKSNVTMTGGNVLEDLLGGGNKVSTTTTNVNISNGKVKNIYGGGNEAGVTSDTNVKITGGNITNAFGGSNKTGDVNKSNVNLNTTASSTSSESKLKLVITSTSRNIENWEKTNYGDNFNSVRTITAVVSNETDKIIESWSGKVNIYGSKLYNNYLSDTDIVDNNGLYTFTSKSRWTSGKDHVLNPGESYSFEFNILSETPNGEEVSYNYTFEGTDTTGESYNDTNIGFRIYGGNNLGGTTNESNVVLDKGYVMEVYGGNNLGGTTTTTNIIVNNAQSNSIYGGGNKAASDTTNITLNNGKITNVYGGSNEADGNNINVTVPSTSSTIVQNLYGGSNQSGNVLNTTLNIKAGTFTNVFGGNNKGGITYNPIINITNGNIGNLYGGGNEATSDTTNITITNGTFNTIYGGGNKAGINKDTKIDISGGTVSNNLYGGGNFGVVSGNTDVKINNTIINGSAYGGGNGASAIVNQNTNISVSGNTIIGNNTCPRPSDCSLFGGGNAAATGTTANNSVAIVNLAGGYIYGNVYGGANTSVVYGDTITNIGKYALNDEVAASDLTIKGTVFGGGEANASGSDTYDYSFISVTKSITVNVDGENFNNLNINGSIFGSGNASSNAGVSTINVNNFGSDDNPKRVTSIQRTNNLNINNSGLILKGATDRTNEYSDTLFTLSIIGKLNLSNNSSLYLESGTNLLQEFNSLTSDNNLAVVTINEETGVVEKNVDNRLYVLEGVKAINVAKGETIDETATDYGEVNGMTFFGLYTYNSSGNVNAGIYRKSINNGDELNWADMPLHGAYVLGLHKNNHDITKDGFYSNFMDEETSTNKVDYINPTPENSDFYMWIIGELIVEYNIDLSASKYSTLGVKEVSFYDFADPNTNFEILGFDYSNLKEGVSLVNRDEVPRIANSTEDADNIMSLKMETGSTGWLNNGETILLSREPSIIGDKKYVGENSSSVPTLGFYLYHSKNLGSTDDMGTVSVVIMAIRRIDGLTSEAKRIVLNIKLSRVLYNTSDYEGAITYGRKYGIFPSTSVDITDKSSLSAYFSLYKEGENIYKPGNNRALVSTSVLPLNTKITMIDLSLNTPKYYYYTVSAEDVTNKEQELLLHGDVSYPLSSFETMGALNSGIYYNNEESNNNYYDSNKNVSSEEFIFIIDFANTNITSDMLDNHIILELKDENGETKISILGNQYDLMSYDIYTSKDAVIDIDGTISKNTIYNGEDFMLDLSTTYTQSKVGAAIISDTKLLDSKLGLKISLIDKDGNIVTGTSLMGLYYEVDNTKYYPNLDGTTRIKISDKVGNVKTWISVNTANSNIPTGKYTLRIESFGSPDGIYYGLYPSDTLDIPINYINEKYGLDIQIDNTNLIINKDSGYNLNNSNILEFNIKYNSVFDNPSLNMKLYRRSYKSVYDSVYELVDLKDYLDMNLIAKNGVDYEYIISSNPSNDTKLRLNLKDNLLNGTYKLEFILYDNDSKIGTVEKYIIIK